MKASIVILIVMSVISTTKSFAQDDCSCSEALEKLIAKMEHDYPGFEEKTKNKIVYDSFKKELQLKAKTLNSEACRPLLTDYLTFFRDGHLFFSSFQKDEKAEKKFVKTDLKAFKKTIGKSRDSLTGIWVSDNFKIGIINEEGIYKAFHISSKNGSRQSNEIVFTLDKNQQYTYYFADQTSFGDSYSLKGDVLQLSRLDYFFLKDDEELLDSVAINARLWELEGFYVKKLTDRTTIVKIKSFNYPFVERIKSLISENENLIGNAENLIIDVTDNGGGTTTAYSPLLPFIMSNATRHLGSEYLSTEFLINSLEEYVATLENNDKNKADIERINTNINLLKENLGKFVVYPDEKRISTVESTLAKNSPKQVVILANKRVGSAAESFLLTARQSKKVKIMGTPTYGGLDYASVRETDFDCLGLSFYMPTNRSARLPEYPIDNIGIQPDIYLDSAVDDWIRFAVEYLEN